MKNRSYRAISVSMSNAGLLIGFTFFEQKDGKGLELKAVYLEYPEGEIMKTVEKSLNIVAGDWERFFITGSHMHAISNIPEKDAGLFDMIVDAQEPMQAFISRYVLEYCGGVSAYDRIALGRIDYIRTLRFGNAAV